MTQEPSEEASTGGETPRRARTLQWAGIAAGGLVLALAADLCRDNRSTAGAVGGGGWVLASLGCLLLLSGLLGRKMVGVYRRAALVLLDLTLAYACIRMVTAFTGRLLSVVGAQVPAAVVWGLLILAGGVSVVGRCRGARPRGLYGVAATLAMNCLVLLACLELAATAVQRLSVAPPSSRQATNAVESPDTPPGTQPSGGAQRDWRRQYLREKERIGQMRYHPWVLWRRPSFQGRAININREGLRRTPGSDCGPRSYRVFCFGGSTMWGTGVPDWRTIPAYLVERLRAQRRQPICMTNFGESGYVSTQSLIALIVQLESGNVPELVIFYDGANDLYAAYQSGQAGAHQNLKRIASRFEGRWQESSTIPRWLRQTAVCSMLERAVVRCQRRQREHQGTNTPALTESVVQVYLNTYRIVGALAEEYGFHYVFFWQPAITTGRKPLTAAELAIRDAVEPALRSLYAAAHAGVETAAATRGRLFDLADVFDDETETVWSDWCHLTSTGNRTVAARMFRHLREVCPTP